MPFSADEQTFLRDLVKSSRQRSQHVKWTDRDGTERITTLTAADAARLNALARHHRVSLPELMRQAAHLPAARPTGAPAAPSEPTI